MISNDNVQNVPIFSVFEEPKVHIIFYEKKSVTPRRGDIRSHHICLDEIDLMTF